MIMASGDLADYSATIQSAIVASFASVAGVAQRRVTLTVTAASVHLEIIIQSDTKAAAEAVQSKLAPSLAEASAASGIMPAGFTVTSIPVITVVAAPGRGSTSLSSPSPESLDDTTVAAQTVQDGDGGGAGLSVGLIVGAAAGGATAFIAAFAFCVHAWLRQQRRRRDGSMAVGGSSRKSRRVLVGVYGHEGEEGARDAEEPRGEAIEEVAEEIMEAEARDPVQAWEAVEEEEGVASLQSVELSGLEEEEEGDEDEEDDTEKPGGVQMVPVCGTTPGGGSASMSVVDDGGMPSLLVVDGEAEATIATNVEAAAFRSSTTEANVEGLATQRVLQRLSRARSVEAREQMRLSLGQEQGRHEHAAREIYASQYSYLVQQRRRYERRSDEEHAEHSFVTNGDASMTPAALLSDPELDHRALASVASTTEVQAAPHSGGDNTASFLQIIRGQDRRTTERARQWGHPHAPPSRPRTGTPREETSLDPPPRPSEDMSEGGIPERLQHTQTDDRHHQAQQATRRPTEALEQLQMGSPPPHEDPELSNIRRTHNHRPRTIVDTTGQEQRRSTAAAPVLSSGSVRDPVHALNNIINDAPALPRHGAAVMSDEGSPQVGSLHDETADLVT